MVFYVARAHAFGIHGNYLLFYILSDACLILSQDLRLKFALTVSWNGEIHIAVTGAKRFGTVPVSAVVRVFVPVIVLAVAEFLVKFYFKALFKKLAMTSLNISLISYMPRTSDVRRDSSIFSLLAISSSYALSFCHDKTYV